LCACSSKPSLPPPVPKETTSNEKFNQDIAVMASKVKVGADYRIGAEDLIEITLFDIADAQGQPRVITSRVSNSGLITLPYIGNATAAGLTTMELEGQLRDSFLKYIHDPQLTVFVKEYRSYRVSILGYVNNPGIVELTGRKSLLEAIAMAGGLTDEAGKNVRLTRSDPEQGASTILVDLDRIANEGALDLNLDLYPDDVVTVPKAGMFYVEGIVKKPGAYPLLQETTVSQAIATAGGADPGLAKLSGTVLYRRVPEGERIAMPVDLAALQRGEQQDFLVEEDDVIVVPVSNPRLIFDRVTRGILRVGFTAPLL
jgi:polysaccharide export outer membrane protein